MNETKKNDDDKEAPIAKNKQSAPPSTDEQLFRLWCITNGWNAIIIDLLKEIGICKISQLKVPQPVSIAKLIAGIDWDECGPSLNEEIFLEKFRELKAMKKVSVRYKNSYGGGRRRNGGGGMRIGGGVSLSRGMTKSAAPKRFKESTKMMKKKRKKKSKKKNKCKQHWF